MDLHRCLTLLACSVAISVASAPRAASAQTWVSDVQLSVASGIEAADQGIGVGSQRARTRIVVGLDLGNDEYSREAYGLRTFVEVERSVAVGAELGYVRWVGPHFNLFFGGVAVLVPETLFGGTVSATYIIPFGEVIGLGIWGSFSALPLGSDRPDDGVVIWGLLGLGIRGRL